MPTYAIGDVQGCFDPLMKLLEKIKYDPSQDHLWFTGDLVNRGPKSLETLRFVKSLNPKPICVLGNHDLGMLAIARGAEPYDPKHHTFSDILEAHDKDELLSWLEQLPLMYYDPKLNYLLVHAGLYPKWDLKLALTLAKEVETVLKTPHKQEFYSHLYGNTPTHWDPSLKGFDRLRFIVNACTRMRFCSPEGELEFHTKESAHKNPPGFSPWFEYPIIQSELPKIKILFGHWAALEGKCTAPNIFALDTGCVWGNALTAFRLEDEHQFKISCP